MDFGLGLVLSFTDNASNGIQNAVNTLNQLTETASNASDSLTGIAQLGAFSIVADQMGNSFMRAGQGIFGMFSKLLGHVQQTGSSFENFRMTLNALYQDEKKAEQQISKLLDFSIKSPFEVEDVKDMLVVLQSQGIDAFEKVEGAISGVHQENLSWIADLMAFKPDIPVQRWKLAITNFLGSGMPKVLENALDMGYVEDIVGHEIGDSVEERMKALVEIVDSKNLSGLADNMSNTWQGVASNIDDAFTKLYLSIADNGVFDELKTSFTGVAGAIMSLDNDEIAALGKTLAEGLNIIVHPITIVAGKVNELIGSLVKLCQTNPGLVKTVMVFVAIAGAMLMLSGVSLKLLSSLGMLTIGLTQFGDSFSKISGMLKTGSMKIIGSLLPLTITLGLIYLAWKTDFAGMRTLLTNFNTDLSNAFKNANMTANLGVGGMMITVRDLQHTGDFWSNFTVGLIKVKTAWEILKDAWGDYTISDELYHKMQALGLTPLISAILDFKWRFEHFKEGFVEGWTTVSDFIHSIFASIKTSFEGTFLETMLDGLTRFFQALTNNDPESWRKVGVVIGEIAAVLLPLSSALRLFNKATTLGGILPRIFGDRNSGGSGSGGLGGRNSGGLKPSSVLKTFGSMIIILGGITLVIEAFGFLSQSRYFNLFLDRGVKTLAKLSTGMFSLMAVIGTLGLLTAGLGIAGISPKVAKGGMKDIAIMLGGLTVIITALGALMSIPYFSEFLGTGIATLNSLSGSLMSVAKIAVVMGLISKMFQMLRLDPMDTLKGVGNLAIILGGLDILIIAVGALNSIPHFSDFFSTGLPVMSNLVNTLKSMFSLDFVGMCALIAVFGLVNPAITLTGLANLALVLGGVAVLVYACGALTKIPYFNEFLETGGDVLAKLFSTIGRVFGSIVGGFAEGVSDALPAIGNNLAQFGENVRPFFESMQGIDFSGCGEFINAFANLVLKLSAGNLMSMFGGDIDLPSIGMQLSSFGNLALPFFNAVAQYPDDGLAKAPKVFEALSKMGGLSFRSGGWLQKLTGEVDLASIGMQLSKAAPAFSAFFARVANYSEEGMEKAPKVFEALSGIGDYDFKTGGLAQLFTGKTRLDNIARQLVIAGEPLGTFFAKVASYSDEGLTKTPKVFEAISGLGNYDFKSGGIAQLFTGRTKMGKLGKELSDFAEKVEPFFTYASGLSDNTLEKADKMLSSLNSLESLKTGGLDLIMNGTWDLKNLGTQLSGFSTNIGDFFDFAAKVPEAGLEKAPKVFDVLSAVGNVEFKSGGLLGGLMGGVSLAKVGTELSDFASNSKGFFEMTKGLSTASLDNAKKLFTSLEGMSGLIDVAMKSNGSLIKFGLELVMFAGSVEAFLSKTGQMGDMSSIDTFTTSLQTLSEKLVEVGSSVNTGVTGITTSFNNLKTTSSDMSTSFCTDMDNMNTKMTTVYAQMVTATNTTFQTLLSTVTTQMNSAVSAVQNAVSTMRGAMNFTWSLPHLAVPHVSVSGGFSLNPPSAPNFSVSWYAKGGVFDSPSVIGVGEAGKEAVMPLENNTGWISELAFMIAQEIVGASSRFTPVDSSVTNNDSSTMSEDKYMTSNVTNNNTTSGDTDNSVTFNEGAIQINCQKATEEEAVKMAKTIMEYIKRQKELDKMLAYG